MLISSVVSGTARCLSGNNRYSAAKQRSTSGEAKKMIRLISRCRPWAMRISEQEIGNELKNSDGIMMTI